MRIALVHDYLTQYGGAERVLETLHAGFPDAPVVTAILDRDALPDSFRAMHIIDGGLGRVPGGAKRHRLFLPVYPAVYQRLGSRIAEAQVVLADSSAWSHHIGVNPSQALVCYCHSPARFLYGDRDYLEPARLPAGAGFVLGGVLRALRAQDQRAARRVDRFIANSRNVADRIARVYGRRATVIRPPVDLDRFVPSSLPPEEWFLVVSRLVPHKRIDLAIDACLRANVPMKIVGDGRSRADLERRAQGRVEFVGAVDDQTLAGYLARCRGLILPGAEDFGMTSVEAQACGRPVIAFGKGGSLESVLDGETGLLFSEQRVESLVDAIERFGAVKWRTERVRGNAERFGRQHFLAAIEEELRAALAERHPRRVA